MQAWGAQVAAQHGVGVAGDGAAVKRAERCERGSCWAAAASWRKEGRVRRKRSFGGRGDMVGWTCWIKAGCVLRMVSKRAGNV